MLTVETYIKHMDCFVKIEPDTDIELVTDVFYVEGAIVIKYYTQEIMGLEQWDLINHLWSYFIDAIDELIEGKWETSFLFPDQPLNIEKRKKESEWAFDNYRGQKIYGREKGVLFSVVICSRCILSIFRTMRCKCFREKK